MSDLNRIEPKVTQTQREIVIRLAKTFGAHELRLFGSHARGTAGSASDIDLLVKFDEGTSPLKVIAFKQSLEKELGAQVDVVEEVGLAPRMAQRVLAGAVSM